MASRRSSHALLGIPSHPWLMLLSTPLAAGPMLQLTGGCLSIYRKNSAAVKKAVKPVQLAKLLQIYDAVES